MTFALALIWNLCSVRLFSCWLCSQCYYIIWPFQVILIFYFLISDVNIEAKNEKKPGHISQWNFDLDEQKHSITVQYPDRNILLRTETGEDSRLQVDYSLREIILQHDEKDRWKKLKKNRLVRGHGDPLLTVYPKKHHKKMCGKAGCQTDLSKQKIEMVDADHHWGDMPQDHGRQMNKFTVW